MIFNVIPYIIMMSKFQAKDMVTLSKTISTKIRDKRGDISDDEVRIITENSFHFNRNSEHLFGVV